MAPRRDDDWPGAASASSRAALFGGLAQRSGAQQQLQVEESDIEEQLDGLHDRVSRLRRVVGAIDDEAKAQSTMVAELEGAMLRTQAALRETLRKMNRVYASGGGGCVPSAVRTRAIACARTLQPDALACLPPAFAAGRGRYHMVWLVLFCFGMMFFMYAFSRGYRCALAASFFLPVLSGADAASVGLQVPQVVLLRWRSKRGLRSKRRRHTHADELIIFSAANDRCLRVHEASVGARSILLLWKLLLCVIPVSHLPEHFICVRPSRPWPASASPSALTTGPRAR
jgi:hypothetical protein